ncbi:hypothetical protein SLA2020_452360 [Shorea laevis]
MRVLLQTSIGSASIVGGSLAPVRHMVLFPSRWVVDPSIERSVWYGGQGGARWGRELMEELSLTLIFGGKNFGEIILGG